MKVRPPSNYYYSIPVKEAYQSFYCILFVYPVNGGWSNWGSWSACPSNCYGATDGTILTRTRTCTNPTPTITGLDCSGVSSDTATCTQRNCPSKYTVSSRSCIYLLDRDTIDENVDSLTFIKFGTDLGLQIVADCWLALSSTQHF